MDDCLQVPTTVCELHQRMSMQSLSSAIAMVVNPCQTGLTGWWTIKSHWWQGTPILPLTRQWVDGTTAFHTELFRVPLCTDVAVPRHLAPVFQSAESLLVKQFRAWSWTYSGKWWNVSMSNTTYFTAGGRDNDRLRVSSVTTERETKWTTNWHVTMQTETGPSCTCVCVTIEISLCIPALEDNFCYISGCPTHFGWMWCFMYTKF